MLWDNADADKMQSTLHNAFAHRPEALSTEALGTEQASGREAAARRFIVTLIASVDHATAILASLRSR